MLTLTQQGLIPNNSQNFYRLIGNNLIPCSVSDFIALLLGREESIPDHIARLLPIEHTGKGWVLAPCPYSGVLIGTHDDTGLFAVEASKCGHYYGHQTKLLSDREFIGIAMSSYWNLNSARVLLSSPLLRNMQAKHSMLASTNAWYLEEKKC